MNDGNPCPEQEETKQCNGFACNQDCDLAEWGEWTLCSKMCNTGSEERTRNVLKEARGLGHCDAADSEHRLEFKECNTVECQTLIPPNRTTLECGEAVDLIVLLDGSGSLGEFGWEASKAMVTKFIDSMIGGENGVNMGLILFSGPADWEDFETCTGSNPNERPDPEVCGITWVKRLTKDISELETAAEKLQWPKRSTLTSLALAEAGSELVNGRQDSPSVVIVITDGKPLSPLNTGEASEDLKTKSRLIWVPVGQAVKDSIEDMKKWASHPWEDNVVEIDTFASLGTPQTVNTLISQFCTQLQ